MPADNLPQRPDNNPPKHADSKKTVEQRVLGAYLWVVAAAVIGMCVLGAAALIFSFDGFWPNAGQPFATVLGGLAVLGGGALALYNGGKTRDTDKRIAADENERIEKLAATDHRRETEKEFNARFTSAASQLAAEAAAVRRAGAYALAALADDWAREGNDGQKQVCIDVLCSYLANKPPTNSSGAPIGPPDPVKMTIQQIIAQHVRATTTEDGVTKLAEEGWHSANFAFEEAILHDLVFANCIFRGNVNFTGATFTGKHAVFASTEFSGLRLNFNNAAFELSEAAMFFDCTFAAGLTSFEDTRFRAYASTDFSRANFRRGRVSFYKSHFKSRETTFTGAVFDCPDSVSFVESELTGTVDFIDANYKRGRINFSKAIFDVASANFIDAKLEKGARLNFTSPQKWEDSRMSFDWTGIDNDVPENVQPKRWPPVARPI